MRLFIAAPNHNSVRLAASKGSRRMASAHYVTQPPPAPRPGSQRPSPRLLPPSSSAATSWWPSSALEGGGIVKTRTPEGREGDNKREGDASWRGGGSIFQDENDAGFCVGKPRGRRINRFLSLERVVGGEEGEEEGWGGQSIPSPQMCDLLLTERRRVNSCRVFLGRRRRHGRLFRVMSPYVRLMFPVKSRVDVYSLSQILSPLLLLLFRLIMYCSIQTR